MSDISLSSSNIISSACASMAQPILGQGVALLRETNNTKGLLADYVSARGRSGGEPREKRGRRNTGALFGVASASIIHHCRTWRCLGLVTGEFSFSSLFLCCCCCSLSGNPASLEKIKKKNSTVNCRLIFPPLVVPLFFLKKTFS